MLRTVTSWSFLIASLAFALFAMAYALFAVAQTVAPVPKLTVSWTAPTTNTDGSAIPAGSLTYQLYQGSDGKYATVGSPVAITSELVTAGLTVGTTVCFYVVAIEAAQQSGASTEACAVVPKPTVIPNPPTQVTVH